MMIAATARGTAVRPAAAAGQQRRHLRPSAAAAAARPRTLAAAPASRGAAAAGARRASHLAAAGRYEAPSSAAGSVVVEVQPDEAAVAAYLCSAVEAAAQKAIAERGCFTLAIPGGSVLKALAGLQGRAIDWSKTHIFWVNHKCVPNDDIKTSSYAKARGIFLDAVGAPGAVATLKGSDDAEAEAAAYAKALAASADADGMERAPSGAPRFDLLLLGVGSDGHVGSLYPGGEATLADPAAAPWVQPVVKAKPPASITLSLGVMNAARSVIVCLTGASKAAAAKTALETAVPRGDFPAQLVQPDLSPAVWLLDEASAAELALVKGGSGDGKSSGGGGAQGGKGQPQSDGSILFTF